MLQKSIIKLNTPIIGKELLNREISCILGFGNDYFALVARSLRLRIAEEVPGTI